MKLLFIQPPIRDFYDTRVRLQPLGLCMLKAAVKKAFPNVQVFVRDFHHGFGRRTVSLPQELSYLKDYYRYPDTNPFSTFHDYYHFGASFQEVAEAVAIERPDLVGISALFSPYYREALACAREIKRRLDVPIIMGGPHVSAAPLSVLQDQNIDFVIQGEGEKAMVAFLKARLSDQGFKGVPGLGYKEKGKPVLNPIGNGCPLNDLPFADLSDLPNDRYRLMGKPLCFVMSTRGCPHRCIFCSVQRTFGEEFRRRSAENVFEEIKNRFEEGYRVIDFEDDNLTFDSPNFSGLLKLLICELPPGETRFTAMNGVSYLGLDRETLVLMKKAGFSSLNLSLVTSNSDVLRRLHRPYTVKKYLEVVENAHSLGFDMVSYQILGLPYETVSDMISTTAMMASLPVLIGASVFYLTPGCPISLEFPRMTEADMVKARSTAMAIETENFGRDDLYTLFICARIINFLKGLGLKEGDFTLREALQAATLLGTRKKTGSELLVRLFRERKLHAATKEGLKELRHFKAELFFQVLRKTRFIRTREGAVITCSDPL